MTSVSVRTLRFYDKVGLLSPSQRSESGYRLYGDEDLVRLQRILALKFLGFSLDEIAGYLRAAPQGLQEALTQQRAMLRERRAQIDAVLLAIEGTEDVLRAGRCNWDSVVEVIRAIQMDQNKDWIEKYFTDEQRATMDELSRKSYTDSARQKLASRGPWTEKDQKAVDERYAALHTGVKRLVAAGADPASSEAQALAGDALQLLHEFTLGDPEVATGLAEWYKNDAALPEERKLFRSPLTKDEQEFLEQAKAIFRERRAT